MKAGDWAWVALGAGVLVWDVWCPRGEMLSDASTRYVRAHPVVARAVMGYVAGHVMHVWPRRVDVFSVAAGVLRRQR